MKKKKYLLWVIPCVLIITCFLIVPLVVIISSSFYDDGFTLKNYISFLTDPFYLNILWRTLKLSIITTVICVLLGVPTAYYIANLSRKKKSLALTLIMFPLLTNAVVRAFSWMTILGKNGIINSVLTSLKIVDAPLSLLYTEFAIVVGSVYLFLPVMINTLVSVMDSIEVETVEAAQTLGCRDITVFLKVILPLSFSGILVGSVLVFTGTMSAYTTPSLLGGNRNMMLATLLNQQVNQLSNWTNAGVISLIMIGLSLAIMGIMKRINLHLDKREGEYNNA